MMYQTGSYIQGDLPKEAQYFKEEVVCGTLGLPMQKPDMERLVDVMVWPEVINIELLNTHKGKSFEGAKLTGSKLVVEVNMKEKLTYVACGEEKNVHAVQYETLKSLYVALPECIEGKKICDLMRANRITVLPYIEDTYARRIDERRVHQCIMLFVDVKIV